jgi:hypothetical protein
MQSLFVILQSVLLALFLTQDTVQLPPLNNRREMVKHLGWTKILLGTAITSGCVLASLLVAIRYNGAPLPWGAKVFYVLWWGPMLYGMYHSWYRPYFFGPTPKDLDEYTKYHGNTHTILPPRNGYPGPNTFHLFLHALMLPCALLGFLKVAGLF